MAQNMFECNQSLSNVLQGISSRLQQLQLRLKLPAVSCSELLGDFDYICRAIDSYKEALQQLNPSAYEELAGISVTLEKVKQSCKPENIVPKESPLLQEIEDALKTWRTAAERLVYSCDFANYPRFLISNCRLFLSNVKDLVQLGDLFAIYRNLSFLLDHLDRLSKFYDKSGAINLKKEAEDLAGEIDVFERQLKSQKIKLDRLSGQIDIWVSRLDSLVVATPPKPIKERPILPARGVVERVEVEERAIIPALRIEGGARSYLVDLGKLSGVSIILGRYDPGGLDEDIGSLPDALKIQEYIEVQGKILYLFTNLQCRWWCSRGDEDCTHRYHVLLSYDPQRKAVRISHFKGYIREKGCLTVREAFLPVRYAFGPQESPRHLVGGIELKPGQTVYLWISGVRDMRQNKPVPVVISLTSSSGKAIRDTIA